MRTSIACRALMDEVFGEQNFVARNNVSELRPVGRLSKYLPLWQERLTFVVWYGRSKDSLKFRTLFGILGRTKYAGSTPRIFVEGECFA